MKQLKGIIIDIISHLSNFDIESLMSAFAGELIYSDRFNPALSVSTVSKYTYRLEH